MAEILKYLLDTNIISELRRIMAEILKYLLDTNIISELRKAERCDSNVRCWFERVEHAQLFLAL